MGGGGKMFLPHLLEMDVGCPKSHQLTLGLNLINGENFAKFHSQHFSCLEVEHTYMWTHAETHTHTNKQTNGNHCIAVFVVEYNSIC